MDKRLFLFLLILYIICTSFLSDGKNYSRTKQDKEKQYLPGSLAQVRITWPAFYYVLSRPMSPRKAPGLSATPCAFYSPGINPVNVIPEITRPRCF
jgi:hypothetical protein